MNQRKGNVEVCTSFVRGAGRWRSHVGQKLLHVGRNELQERTCSQDGHGGPNPEDDTGGRERRFPQTDSRIQAGWHARRRVGLPSTSAVNDDFINDDLFDRFDIQHFEHDGAVWAPGHFHPRLCPILGRVLEMRRSLAPLTAVV